MLAAVKFIFLRGARAAGCVHTMRYTVCLHWNGDNPQGSNPAGCLFKKKNLSINLFIYLLKNGKLTNPRYWSTLNIVC